MTAPSVSVVIPTYNREALVAESVESVMAQTHANFELIVVDDGSTDGTFEALLDQLAGEPRARLLRKPNGGTASARNHGLEAARAPWTAFLDSDDLWAPDYLASQLEILGENPEASMVQGDVIYRNQGRAADTLFEDPTFRAPVSVSAMCSGGWGLPSAIVVSTEVARSLGFSTHYRIIEDTDFLMRFHLAGHSCVLNPDAQAVWRRPDSSGTPSKTDSSHQADLEMLELLEAARRAVGEPGATAERIHVLHRSIAKLLVSDGRLLEARPHLLAWWRARPQRMRPLVLYLKSLVAGQWR